MGVEKQLAIGLGRLTHWGLRTVAHRPASQLPGRVALSLDSDVIADLAHKLRRGSIVVCGTNGKTTTTNVVASALEEAGSCVLCNREGANMAAGVAAALLPRRWADWAVIETDELSTIHVVPALKPAYFVLLNLFRDQLDRSGEIDHVQDTIAKALMESPSTKVLVCGDDPLCMGVARRVQAQGMGVLTFGMGEDLGLAPDRVAEARFCQVCGAELVYDYRSYAQLGAFRCPNGDFVHPELDFVATDVRVGMDTVSLRVTLPVATLASANVAKPHAAAELHFASGGVYMAYNLLAAYAVASLAGVGDAAFQSALDAFDLHNGRLQHFCVGGRDVILNLAKNPTGFNQNLSLLAQDARQKTVCVVVNDNYNDGRDISWIWDVDFERLAQGIGVERVLVGGHRADDLRVRMKYAGIDAAIVNGVEKACDSTRDLPPGHPLYVLCNYSALAPAKAELEGLATHDSTVVKSLEGTGEKKNLAGVSTHMQTTALGRSRRLVIAHLYPELLNLYGDSGNIICLRKRMEWRGIEAQVREVHMDDTPSFADVDVVFVGGGSDREQRIVCEFLLGQQRELSAYVEDGGVLAAVCGGYQLLGDSYLLGDEKVPGLSLVDLYTDRGSPRIIGNIVVESDIVAHPIVGYENHGGRTHLGPGVEPLGRVLHGHGNDMESGYEGCRYKNVLGTYVHGPLLPKNPGVADWLIARALERRYGSAEIDPVDDSVELAANSVMVTRLLR